MGPPPVLTTTNVMVRHARLVLCQKTTGPRKRQEDAGNGAKWPEQAVRGSETHPTGSYDTWDWAEMSCDLAAARSSGAAPSP
ncbi:hypothetical protein VTJ04DRAFT_7761 [Mycothermus thermophilus]|uniref:uncharacterized protein n=1 Tax=Humicola insolens TaxID=85995 RepID=UPI0037427861